MLLREIRVVNLLPKTQISISGANFSAVKTEADFFNRIRQKWSLTVDKTENDSMFWRGVFLKQHGTVSEQT